MTKVNQIWFDMDGTVYDLYGVDGWLEMLHAEDETAYSCGRPMYDMNDLNSVLSEFTARGVVVGVITWAAMNGSAEFNTRTANVKRNWIMENMPAATEFYCVDYGTPKHEVTTLNNAVLVDDNADVRAAWTGVTIDANNNIIEQLKNLLATL